ncbi:MAG: mcpU [Caulobacteraceae bacterium]|nr:mcpU [Caulobacteraceae bacterium]
MLAQLNIRMKLVVAFGAVFLISAVASGLSMQATASVKEATKWNTHTYEVLTAADAAGAAMVNQETGVRGYLLSGAQNFLQPFETGKQAFDANLAKLTELTSDNPVQQGRLKELGDSAQKWRNDVAGMELRLMSNPTTMEAARDMERSGAGKQGMDAIRAKLAEIRGAESALLTTRSAKLQADLQRSQVSLIIGGLVAGLSVAAMCWLLSRSIGDPISAMTGAMKQLAAGRNDIDVPALEQKDEIGQMAGAVQVFKEAAIEKLRLEQEAVTQRGRTEEERARNEQERAAEAQQQAFVVQAIGGGLEKLSAGELTFRLNQSFPPAYEQLRSDFNDVMARLQDTMKVITTTSQGVRAGTEEISQASDNLSRRTEQQAASLEETAAALDEITATVKRSADGAKQASSAASGAKLDAERSGVIVRDAVTAMAEIEQGSSQITQIIGVIDEIAFQTNLLALNAGVEAARAGDAGRGFAVVAQEVRALAQRSAEAAKEIKALISNSSSQVERGVQLVGDTGEALVAIVKKVTEIDALISEIAESAMEQSTGLGQVNTAVNQMDQVTQQNAAMVEESTAAAAKLKSEANELATLMSRFHIGDTRGSGARPELADAGRHAPGRNPVAKARAKVAAFAGGGAAAALAPEGWEEF